MKRLKPLIPSRGCPLSFVTALELFRGLSKSKPEKLDQTLRPLLLAARISRRHVLRTPLTFAASELFQAEEALHHRPKLLIDWLQRIQMPRFPERFASGEVKIDFERIESIFAKIAAEQHRPTEMMLNRVHPNWREERRKGSALPESKREVAKRGMRFDILKGAMPELLLTQMEVERTPTNIEKAKTHCDAYFTFLANLERNSTLGNYRFEDNPNDFHDGLQLLYLTRPRFCVVTDDGPSLERIRQSSQRARIMSLAEFLATAA